MEQKGKYLDKLDSKAEHILHEHYWGVIISLVEDDNFVDFQKILLKTCKKFFPAIEEDEKSYISKCLKKKYSPDDSFNFGQKLLNNSAYSKSEKILNYLLEMVDPFEVVDMDGGKTSCFRETVPKYHDAAYMYLFQKGLLADSGSDIILDEDTDCFWASIYKHTTEPNDTIRQALGEVADRVSDALIDYSDL